MSYQYIPRKAKDLNAPVNGGGQHSEKNMIQLPLQLRNDVDLPKWLSSQAHRPVSDETGTLVKIIRHYVTTNLEGFRDKDSVDPYPGQYLVVVPPGAQPLYTYGEVYKSITREKTKKSRMMILNDVQEPTKKRNTKVNDDDFEIDKTRLSNWGDLSMILYGRGITAMGPGTIVRHKRSAGDNKSIRTDVLLSDEEVDEQLFGVIAKQCDITHKGWDYLEPLARIVNFFTPSEANGPYKLGLKDYRKHVRVAPVTGNCEDDALFTTNKKKAKESEVEAYLQIHPNKDGKQVPRYARISASAQQPQDGLL